MNAEYTRSRIANCVFGLSLSLIVLILTGCKTSRDYPGPVHGLTFNGAIKSIDLQNHRLTVTPLKPGEAFVFVWESTTKFWQKGVPIRPDQLELTWPVRVHYHTVSGARTAHHVYVELSYPVVH